MAQRAERYFTKLGLQGFTVRSLSKIGWRTRAKLAVRCNPGNTLAFGLFKRGTHDVVPIPSCFAHHPKINEAMSTLSQLPSYLGYNESSSSGQLRYVQAVVERSSKLVQMSFVLNLPSLDCPEVQEWEKRAVSLFSSNRSLWHSFWLNLQPMATNTIFGPTWKHVVGPPLIWETFVGCKIPFLPSHFSQANLDMFECLLQDLATLIPEQARVVELFAGMGVISLVIRPKCTQVTAIERDESALSAFLQAKDHLPSHLHDGIRFVVGDASEQNEVVTEATTIIVDPPRKGLPKNLIRTIAQSKNVRTLLYISCHFPTLERDTEELIEQGGFSCSFARSYLFFPGTDQIETLVKLIR
jgi:tRNA/tmRNA/rRNA uracil-C5-methylase (TrmA/RlmC/RlmD family)